MTFKDQLNEQMKLEKKARESYACAAAEPDHVIENLGHEGFWCELNHREGFFLCCIYRHDDEICAELESSEFYRDLYPDEVGRVQDRAVGLWNESRDE